MVKERMDLLELLRKGGMDGGVDFLREALRVLVEGIMDAEVSSRIGAEYGERSPERVTQRRPLALTRCSRCTHRIAVDAQGFDFRATAPFQGFVDAEDQRTIALIQVLEQQHEQDASRLAGRPHRPIEHLMVAGVVEVAHEAQRRGHGALARGQYGAGQQDLGFQPGRAAKQRGEGMEYG